MPVRLDRPSEPRESQGRTGPAHIPSRYAGSRDRLCWEECRGRGFLHEERLPVPRSRVPGDIENSGSDRAASRTGLPFALLAARLVPTAEIDPKSALVT